MTQKMTTQKRKRYALVGTGSRADMFFSALMKSHADVGELVALCDPNETRMNYYNGKALERAGTSLPTYRHTEFGRMVSETKPDAVIVTTIDRTHHTYIVRAMELGCDVITEKPMTIDEKKCQEILDAVKRTGKKLAVTFNYRYSPRNSKVKEILQSGEIGEVLSVHFEWLLDTQHGADYFRRWHRDKRNSGGLLVHKATHHFDLVNWWLNTGPETVFAMGDLRFYGRANAERRGVTDFYDRYHNAEKAKGDPFALALSSSPKLRSLYLEAEHEDGYFRDQNVFGDGISIEDTLAVMVRYESGAVMSYSLNAHCPWEGYRVMFNGSKGRLEVEVVERSYVSGAHDDPNAPEQERLEIDPSYRDEDRAFAQASRPTILLQKHWGKAQEIPFEEAAGGHGGGDARLLDDLFRGAGDDPLGRAAGCVDGAKSILVGIAANQSVATGQAVRVGELVSFRGF